MSHGDTLDFLTFRARQIVERMAARYGWSIQPQDIVFIPGVVVGFNIAAYAVCAPGEAMLALPRHLSADVDGREYHSAPPRQYALTLQPDGSYTIDWAAFEAALTPDVRMFLLCNPPTIPSGRYSRDELSKMAGICL